MGRFGRMVYGTGRAQVTISQEHARAFDAVLERAIPETGAAMADATAEVMRGAQKEWPWKTGRSKRALERGIRFQTAAVEAFVRNPVRYAYYIRWGEKGGLGRRVSGRVVQDLIFKPGLKLADKIAQVSADELARLAGRG